MKKTFFTALRAMCVGVMTLAAVSCYDDSYLNSEIDGLKGEVDGLAARLDELESRLNDNVKAVNALTASMTELETSVKKVLETAGAEDVKAALEQKIAELETKLTEAIAKGDQASADALAKQKTELEEAMTELQDGFNSSLAASEKKLNAAIATLEAAMGEELETLLAKMDKADGKLDGKITDLAAAVEQVKKDYAAADTQLGNKLSADLVAEIAKVVAKIAVVDVEVQADKVVLTLATGETIEIAKPLAEQQPETETPATPEVSLDGLVTIIEGENGVKFWAVIVNGEPESLGVQVGSDVNLEFKVEEGQLMYTTNGENWLPTGAYTNEGKLDFFQGETASGNLVWDDEILEMVPEMVKNDFYTFVFAGQEYYLPMYKADNSVVLLKSGKTYFTYGEEKVIDVVLDDLTSTYVMNKPEGWRASLSDTKLTVVAPAEAMITGGYAEADGEVLLHCTTADGKCKVARLAVATTAGFSLTVDKEGNITIINPEVVTSINMMMGWEETDFNDAYLGLAPIATFEADPIAYVENAPNDYDNITLMINNWKGNTRNWDTGEYVYGGPYTPGEYEVDVINVTVAELYESYTYDELPRGSQYIVWACPTDSEGQPRYSELVYGYYAPVDVEAKLVGEPLFNDILVDVALYGADSYYVGKVSAEECMSYDMMTGESKEDFEGYIMNQFEAMSYGYGSLGTLIAESGEYSFSLSSLVPEGYEATALSPNTKYYFYIIPVTNGKAWSKYTYSDFESFVYTWTTTGLVAGGTGNVEFEAAESTYSSVVVDLTASEGTNMVYYNFLSEDEFNAMSEEELASLLISEGYVIAGVDGVARYNDAAPGQKFVLAAIAVDAAGQYGEVCDFNCSAKELVYSETFVATVGTIDLNVEGTTTNVTIPVTVEGGEAANYYYYFNSTARDDEWLDENLIFGEYPCYKVTSLPVFKAYFNYYASYQFAVIVESTTGELSKPVIITVNKPAAEETPAE